MAQHLRIANADFRPRRPDEFAMTETAQDILRSLELMRSRPEPSLVMISGAPGVGKSKALEYFCAQEGHGALYWSIANGEGKPTAISETLLRGFRQQANGMSLSARRDMLAGFIGRGRVLILDEAQYLEPQGAEWARALAEDGEFHLVLSGDLSLQALVNKMPPLRSRVHANRPVIVKHASRADVACMVEGSTFATPATIDLLHAVARLNAELRSVESVTRLAQLFAGQDQPGPEHLKAAIADLKLATKGVLE